jgi:hypothetical protein
MNETLVPQITIVILGAVVTYFFAIYQNITFKKKEVTIKYLIDAWIMLERASCREDNRYNTDVEIAIANIQLFGTTRQIELAQKFTEEIARNHSGSTLELLNQLRKDLRKELKLEKPFVDMKFLRFSNSKLPNS